MFQSLFRSLFRSRRTPTTFFGPPPAFQRYSGWDSRCFAADGTASRGPPMTPTARDLTPHLTTRDQRILEDLEQYRLLTTRQLQRLHFPAAPLGTHSSVPSATRGTTRVLSRLETVGAIARLARRIGGIKHGSALTIWQLAAAGERHLRSLRGDTVRRRYEEPSYPFTAHTLAVADIAVNLREHAAARQFELLELETEPACWRPFPGDGTTTITLKPDLLTVTADEHTETHSFIEVDLGTEHLPVLLRKCLTYQRHHETGHEQAERGLYPAVVWIVPDPIRARRLRDAIAADNTLDMDLFWITTTDQALRLLAPYEHHHPSPKGESS